MATPERTAAWYIFKRNYPYSLEYSFFLGVDRMNVTGVVTDGSPEDFNRVMSGLQATSGSIMEIAEFYSQGAEIEVPPEHIVDIYQRIENHFADFEHALRRDVNMEYAKIPMDDFKMLDLLAEKLFPYARHYSRRLPKPVEAKRLTFQERMRQGPLRQGQTVEAPVEQRRKEPQVAGSSRIFDLIREHEDRRHARNY